MEGRCIDSVGMMMENVATNVLSFQFEQLESGRMINKDKKQGAVKKLIW